MKNNKVIFWLLSLTWGLPMTLVGAATALILYWKAYIPIRVGPCWVFTVGSDWGGINLGPVAIVSKTAKVRTIYHEVGHALQNCLYGFLFPFIVAIPSAIRYWYRKWTKPTTDYDAIWFEGQATRWGIKYLNMEEE